MKSACVPILRRLAFPLLAAVFAYGPLLGKVVSFEVESEYQNGKREIRVLPPDDYSPAKKYRVLYVLPVEPGFESRYGYGLGLLEKMDVHNRRDLILVQPGFEKTPWYGDHDTDPKTRQESHLLRFVVPYVEERYSVLNGPEGRLLFGFSKSGWGAFSLILRRPDFWGYAAGWDMPANLPATRFGLGKLFGSAEQLAKHRPDLLARAASAAPLKKRKRLVLTGSKGWGAHVRSFHQALVAAKLPHHFDDTLAHPHRWDERWVGPTLDALLKLTETK